MAENGNKTRVMAIGAHADECHYGCGGTLSLLARAGCECRMLHVALHRWCKNATADLAPYDAQMQKGAEMLGCSLVMRGDRSLERMYSGNEEERQIIIEELEKFQPDVLFIHWPKDSHPEHRMTAVASYEAMLKTMWKGTVPPIREIYAFEAGPEQTMLHFLPDLYVDISSAMQNLENALKTCLPTSTLHQEKHLAASFRGYGHSKGGFAEAFKIVKFPEGSGLEQSDLLLRRLLAGEFRWAGAAPWPYANQEYLR